MLRLPQRSQVVQCSSYKFRVGQKRFDYGGCDLEIYPEKLAVHPKAMLSQSGVDHSFGSTRITYSPASPNAEGYDHTGSGVYLSCTFFDSSRSHAYFENIIHFTSR